MSVSENISILVEIIKAIENNPTGDIMCLMLDAVETVAENINSTPHHVERVLNDVITGGDMRYNLVDFSRIVSDYLRTGDKIPVKELLMKNIQSDSDIEYVNNWYAK
ncbi:MAG: hypothetical protein K2G36_03295 [Ruminococcus sp.]|nr:hypothetical protein [Ruminococcus sp.]